MHKSIVIAFIICVMVPAAAIAQDTSPPTPELKDFRLDKPVPPVTGPVDPAPVAETKPEPAKPAAETPAPVAAATQSEPGTETKTQKSAPKPTAQPLQGASKTQVPRADSAELPKTAASVSAAGERAPETELTADPLAESAETGAESQGPDIAPLPNAEAPKPGVDLTNNPLMPALVGALAVGLLIFLGWLWSRRRRRAESDADTEEPLLLVSQEVLEPGVAQTPMSQPDSVPEFDSAADIVPTTPIIIPVEPPTMLPASASVAPDPPAQKPVQKIVRCEIGLAFTPDRVVISFNSLTLYGDLEIHNFGQVTAYDIRLQTELISANANQQDEIAGFAAKGEGAQNEPLDDIAPGEKINLALALVLPLAELNSFAIGTQKLTVPILLARLDFRSSKDKTSPRAVETLSCLIGREASPPTPKMGPLRLDTGTRSYTGLGQRSLAV